MALGMGRTSAERSAEFECDWFYLALPRLIAWGFSEDAGSGDPAYKAGFGLRYHVLVLAEPRPGSRTPAWNWADSPTGVEGGAVFFSGRMVRH
jgi:hypothetical protein